MAAGAKTRSLGKPARVAGFPDDRKVQLRVASQAKVAVTLREHFLIDGTVHLMASGATLSQGFVFPHERPALVLMAFVASLVGILHLRGGPGSDILAVGIMAIRAAHFSFQNRMMIGQTELGLFVQMAFKASAGIFFWVDNPYASLATRLHVQAPRPMAHLAALGLHVFVRNADPGMRGL